MLLFLGVGENALGYIGHSRRAVNLGIAGVY